ncbi:hypothetical protein M199_gp274 [Halogranum tailed virus 1]|uniref:Uncharacterized protein n=1 Tax=Halogranum tailed virus 1 TaxID=1273749 RepID=R4TL60_9CAUD|nr:hypothetical protein M199_gp274 [Halogranum tailed virus 1]AGM11392.1 hypothetical protein HGTV1_66 [Halogranum tailed virus 1]
MPRQTIDVSDEDEIIMRGNGMESRMDVSDVDGEIVAPEGITYELVE